MGQEVIPKELCDTLRGLRSEAEGALATLLARPPVTSRMLYMAVRTLEDVDQMVRECEKRARRRRGG